jgi:hypothetical protein
MNAKPLLHEYDVEVCIDGHTTTLRVLALDKEGAKRVAEDRALWMSEAEEPVVKVWCATRIK